MAFTATLLKVKKKTKNSHITEILQSKFYFHEASFTWEHVHNCLTLVLSL